MNSTIAIDTFPKPFVGLRPFESTESELFFGREEQVRQLLGKLHQSNFVAVVGSSGSGKSSLVKAGLIPALKAGFLNRGDHWYICSFRPGDHPIHYLAKSLKESFDLTQPVSELEKAIQTEGSDAITNLVEPYVEKSTGSSLLILIDQFEELFTHFKNVSEQSTLMYRFEFIKLILELIHGGLPIYVILTMRSDFIGKCNMFHGLAEELSNSQFLVPRLQAGALCRVIEGPMKLFSCSVEHGLSQRMLNDLEDNEDLLPVLQHTLSQIWRRRTTTDVVTYDDYRKTGGLKNSISINANAIYENLLRNHPALKDTVQEMFQYLIDFDDSKREGVRQPRKVYEIQLVTGASFDEVKIIFDAFSVEDACFLFSSSTHQLESQSLIDISHESLMREWDKFKEWKNEEEKNKRYIERLNEFAAEYRDGKRNTLQGTELGFYLNWSKYVHYNQHDKKERVTHWAKRYNIEFEKVKNYIQTSKRKFYVRIATWSALALIVVFAGIFIYYDIKKRDIESRELKLSMLALHSQMNRSDSLQRAETLRLKLDNTEALNRNLATESQAKQALFESNARVNQLEQRVFLLTNTIKAKDDLIQSQQSDNSARKNMEMTLFNEKTNKDLRIAQHGLLKAQLSVDSLSFIIDWYKKKSGLNYVPANTSFAHITPAKLVQLSRVDLGKGLNYQVCLALDVTAGDLQKIKEVRYYLNGQSVMKIAASRQKFKHCMQIKARTPVYVELEFKDNSLKTIEYKW